MKKIIATTLALLLFSAPALAGTGSTNYNSSGSTPFQTGTNGNSNNSATMNICDVGGTWTTVLNGCATVSTYGSTPTGLALAVNAYVSSNAFLPGGYTSTYISSLSSVTATTSAATVLPTGTVAEFENTGPNLVYVTLGGSSVSATTTTGIPVCPYGTVGVLVGSNTYFAAITATLPAISSSTSLLVQGGSGTPYSTCGAGIPDGGIVTLGTTNDAASASTGGSLMSAVRQLHADNVTLTAAINTGNPADPCATNIKTNYPIAFNGTSTTQQIALSGTTRIYICSIHLIAQAATVFNIITGTGTNCASGTPAAIFGSLTTANGESYSANGGITYGNGAGTIGVTPAGYALCFNQTNAVYVSGNLTYVQQ